MSNCSHSKIVSGKEYKLLINAPNAIVNDGDLEILTERG